jgi:hypothetical protein
MLDKTSRTSAVQRTSSTTWGWSVDGAIGRTLQIGLILSLSKDDPVDSPMLVDEGDHGFHRRSSSA